MSALDEMRERLALLERSNEDLVQYADDQTKTIHRLLHERRELKRRLAASTASVDDVE